MEAQAAGEQSKGFQLSDMLGRMAFMVRALRSRNYRLFFSGQIISLLGSWITQVATIWLAWKLTSSPLMLGAVGFAAQIPAFLLSPIAGVFVDQWPRHRILIITQALAMLQSFLLAALALTGYITIWHILALMVFQGFINAFDMPARQAFVVEMVEDPEDLSNAIALNSSMFNAARTVGAAVGGLILAVAGAGYCFLLDGISYMGVIVCLLLMTVPKFKRKQRENPWIQLRDGYKYAIGFPPIRTLLLLVAGISLLGMPYSVLMPVVATKVLHGSEGTYAMLTSVAGLGALTGAMVLAARKSVRGLTRVIPYCTLAFGVSLLIFSYSSYLFISLVAIFVMGYTLMTQNASCNTILQTIVDPERRGRVMSFYIMAFMGMMPLGSIWGGAMADRIGTQNTLMLCGFCCVGLSFWFARNLPVIAEHIRPIYQRMGIIGGMPPETDEASKLTQTPGTAG